MPIPPETYTLKEFIAEETARLERFKKYWQKNNKENVLNFPDELSPGEWDEQFLVFSE